VSKISLHRNIWGGCCFPLLRASFGPEGSSRFAVFSAPRLYLRSKSFPSLMVRPPLPTLIVTTVVTPRVLVLPCSEEAQSTAVVRFFPWATPVLSLFRARGMVSHISDRSTSTKNEKDRIRLPPLAPCVTRPSSRGGVRASASLQANLAAVKNHSVRPNFIFNFEVRARFRGTHGSSRSGGRTPGGRFRRPLSQRCFTLPFWTHH